MTIDYLQGIVRRLANQMPVRYYLWLNYPQDPQLMGIELFGPNGKGGWNSIKGEFMLEREMLVSGFGWDGARKMWTAPRHEVEKP